ncbi:MAG: hypothetical protein NT165_02305 [Candidatus Falkowbacteria bacterium]|nr:hypothetical protein [Candidatus Falkowbacteria bacterium]
MKNKKINLIAADMGYGHQRAAYPLLDLSGGEILTLNNYDGIPTWEKKYWEDSLKSYEEVSRFKKVPIIGRFVFSIMDYFQKIDPLYPFRDLSEPTIQQRYFYRFIKKGLGKDLVKKLNKEKLPFVTTFFVAAQAAEYHNYQGDIFCVICDTDASRAWAPLEPKNSRIKYLVPSEKVKQRFLMYGLKEENLIITGFPLPKENIGQEKEIVKADLSARLNNLDPEKQYQEEYQSLISGELSLATPSPKHPLTITFAVGGAGAQKEIGAIIINQFLEKLKSGEMIINLVAGNRPEIRDYFLEEISRANLTNQVRVIFAPDKISYFKKFNECLRSTDILWTKPSELSFYCALGLPIIISSPVGSQEDFNREWLISVGGGVDSLEPEYVAQWLTALLDSGRLARAAMDAFLNAELMGVYNIEKMFSK